MQVIASECKVCIQRVKQRFTLFVHRTAWSFKIRLLNADVSDTDIYMSASLG